MENFAEENCISLICNGEFDALPGYSIGELFEGFFDNINYNVVKGNEVFVDFTGEAVCDDEPCTVLIRFKVEEDMENFEITLVKVNDEELEEEEILDLLEDIAFVSGAIIEDECCSGDCDCDDHHNCSHDDCDCEDCNCDDEEYDEEFDEEYEDEDPEEYDDDDSDDEDEDK